MLHINGSLHLTRAEYKVGALATAVHTSTGTHSNNQLPVHDLGQNFRDSGPHKSTIPTNRKIDGVLGGASCQKIEM